MPTGDGHRSRGRRGRGPAVAWEVVGMSGGDQDKWLEPEQPILGWLGLTRGLPTNAYGLLIRSLPPGKQFWDTWRG